MARKLPVVGNINPFLYKAWALNPKAFTDITRGDSQDQGCCNANFATVPGWVRTYEHNYTLALIVIVGSLHWFGHAELGHSG